MYHSDRILLEILVKIALLECFNVPYSMVSWYQVNTDFLDLDLVLYMPANSSIGSSIMLFLFLEIQMLRYWDHYGEK